jgi:succinate-semialdehyde dehydrogenase/glutarate-semialdehyde dehydrogenase
VQRLSLELGGNAPALIFADADLEDAADIIIASRFRHSGQTCVCVQRVFVEDAACDAFTEAAERRVRMLRTGNAERKRREGDG